MTSFFPARASWVPCAPSVILAWLTLDSGRAKRDSEWIVPQLPPSFARATVSDERAPTTNLSPVSISGLIVFVTPCQEL